MNRETYILGNCARQVYGVSFHSITGYKGGGQCLVAETRSLRKVLYGKKYYTYL